MGDQTRQSALTVTVAICAYTEERWAWIEEAIESIRDQTACPDQLLLVIDHNPALLERSKAAFPDVLVVANDGQRGLSDAKNTALARADGALIAFLDDDATAETDWVETLRSHFVDDAVLSVGSRVDPVWERHPKWFPPEFYWALGCSHRGLPDELEEVRNSFGGATMVRVAAARDVGGFASELGRVLGNAGGGEETEFCIRLRGRNGGKVLYDPSTAISHRVPAARCTWRYLATRCRGEGRSKAVMRRRVGASSALSSERRFVRRVIPAAYVREVRRTIGGDLQGARGVAALTVGLCSTLAGFAAEELRSAAGSSR